MKTKRLWSLITRYAKSGAVRIYFTIAYEIVRLVTKIEINKVLFISDVRNSLDGNFKFVWEYLTDEKYHKVTYLKADRREPVGLAKFNKMIYDFATAECIMLEDYFRYTSFVRLKKEQKICQLWHGCGAYKKFGYSRIEGNEHIRIHKGYKKYTHVITSGDDICKDYAEAFGVSKNKVRATGIPRTDIFFDKKMEESAKRRLYEKYPMLKGKKTILFAPTYRGIRADDAWYDFEQLDFDEIYNKFHEEYVFVFKWHPALYNNLLRAESKPYDLEKYKGFYLDLSQEREINDLLFLADVMITDYSSVIFEYALLDKPIVFFMYDMDLYANGRGMYYDLHDYVYGPIARNCGELIDAIQSNEERPEERKKFVSSFMNACDGNATKKVCNWVFGEEN